MDIVFIAASVAVGGAYAWLPVRDKVCAHRGHRLGRERAEDGQRTARRTCMCSRSSLVVQRDAVQPQKGATCPAPAWVRVPASTPSP